MRQHFFYLLDNTLAPIGKKNKNWVWTKTVQNHQTFTSVISVKHMLIRLKVNFSPKHQLLYYDYHCYGFYLRFYVSNKPIILKCFTLSIILSFSFIFKNQSVADHTIKLNKKDQPNQLFCILPYGSYLPNLGWNWESILLSGNFEHTGKVNGNCQSEKVGTKLSLISSFIIILRRRNNYSVV